jgi:fructose/tagatose bisphosphate aldolase
VMISPTRSTLSELAPYFLYYISNIVNSPRVWVREGEKTMSSRVKEALIDFNTANQLC